MGFTAHFMLGLFLVLLICQAKGSYHQKRETQIISNNNETSSIEQIQQNNNEKEEEKKIKLIKPKFLNTDKPKTDSSDNDGKISNNITNTTTKLNKSEGYNSNNENNNSREDIGRSINIDKYISKEFHSKNNEYTLPISEDTEKYVDPNFNYHITTYSSPYFTTEDYHKFNGVLTTPKSPIFDQKYHEAVKSIDQTLDHIDEEEQEEIVINHPQKKESTLDEIDDKLKRNDTKRLNFINYKNVVKNNTDDRNSKRRDILYEEETKLDYVGSFNNTEILDDNPIENKINKEDDKDEKEIKTEQKSVEITTESNQILTTSTTKTTKISNELSNKIIETENIKPVEITVKLSTIKPHVNDNENKINKINEITSTTSTTNKSVVVTPKAVVNEEVTVATEIVTVTNAGVSITDGSRTVTKGGVTVTTEDLSITKESGTSTTGGVTPTNVITKVDGTVTKEGVAVTIASAAVTTEDVTVTTITTTEIPENVMESQTVTDSVTTVTEETTETVTSTPEITTFTSEFTITTETPVEEDSTFSTATFPVDVTLTVTEPIRLETTTSSKIRIEETKTESSFRTSKGLIFSTTAEITTETMSTAVTEPTNLDYDSIEDSQEHEDKIPKPSPSTSTEIVFGNVENHTSSVPELKHDFKYPVPEVDKNVFDKSAPDSEESTLTTIDSDGLTLEPSDSDNSGTIAAIAISSVGGVCLVLLAGLLIIMRKRQKRFNYGKRCRPVSLDDYSMDNISVQNSLRRKGALRASKRSYGNPAFEDPSTISHPLNFSELAKFLSNSEDIHKEFDEIPQIIARTTELPEGCDVKNRYANVIPLPETRVFLTAIDGFPNSDYINANYVTGPKNVKGYYIACQAPMDNTVDDFWRMIWEQQSKVILMLTLLFENRTEKCFDYLPPSEVSDCHRLFGDFQVTLKKREVKDKYIISSLQLKNMETNTWRDVTHFWYLGWPEKGVPIETNSLIAFLIEARSYMKTSSIDRKQVTNGDLSSSMLTHEVSPVVVHCSPGTGRTGVVIACDIGIREFEQTRVVDVPRIVYRIRRDRASAVQTKEQYAFIYKVIGLYASKLTGGGLESL